ncbi:MAG: zinc-dependent alcohol dehydrogenase family protein [Candidatus Rokubacteria bacterium]|nr:zinc-dependent alcohol dehydrogenase family protein [Candidatus Rokubacteria bacterium]
MRAMLLRAPAPVETDPLEAAFLPEPTPGAGQVRLEVSACGLCHTDLHEVEGDLPLPKRPVIPGHQIVGRVDALGEGARRFRLGERLGVPWLHSTCGACPACRRGEENLCDHARFTGYDVDGGYATHAVVPEAFACRLPEALPDAAAAPLLCAGIIGYRALRLSDVKPGERLGLFGFGASAHIAIQISRFWQCEVWVFTRTPEHRALATALGASWVGGAEEEPPGQLDRAISFAPAGSLIPRALAKLRKGGTLALAGIHLDRIPEMPYSLLYGERTLRSVTASTRRDAEELLALAERIPIKTEVEVFPLADANAALQRLKASRISGAGVLQVEG